MIYEDASTYVFLDQKPINPGHMLVVPKAHFTNIFDLPEETFVAMTKTAQKVAKGLATSLSIGDINVYMNNGAHSGQMVFHSHIHIIPRYENDGYGLWHGKEYPDAGEALAVGELIKKALA
jgi:histidine triad (HIT) family protein